MNGSLFYVVMAKYNYKPNTGIHHSHWVVVFFKFISLIHFKLKRIAIKLLLNFHKMHIILTKTFTLSLNACKTSLSKLLLVVWSLINHPDCEIMCKKEKKSFVNVKTFIMCLPVPQTERAHCSHFAHHFMFNRSCSAAVITSATFCLKRDTCMMLLILNTES